MAILSSLFGNSDSEDGNSSSLLGVLDVTSALDFNHTSYNQSVDDDGSSDTSYHNTSFGSDLDVGSALQNITDSFSSSDSHGGGGLFG